jgi:signal peptidase II
VPCFEVNRGTPSYVRIDDRPPRLAGVTVSHTAGPARTRSSTWRRWAATALVAAVVVLVDQLAKTWAVNALTGEPPRHILGTLQLNLTYNSGGAFGLGGGMAPFFMVAAVILVLVLARLGNRLSGVLGVICLGLVLGGAIGNLSDRLFRDTGGAVVDFIDPQFWPIFNVADASIVCGGLLLLFVRSRPETATEVTPAETSVSTPPPTTPQSASE